VKTIYLVRHAKSSWKYAELDDFERPLNKRGRKSLLAMRDIFKNLKVAPDLILSSPATRAAMTARAIADIIDYPLDKIQYREALYMAGDDILVKIIKEIEDSVQKAMVIGHNPGLTDLANYVSDQVTANIPTCGMFCVDLDVSSWNKTREHCGTLRFFEFPKKHAS
jgi:phosphohistidine phosphatase